MKRAAIQPLNISDRHNLLKTGDAALDCRASPYDIHSKPAGSPWERE